MESMNTEIRNKFIDKCLINLIYNYKPNKKEKKSIQFLLISFFLEI